jgi:hypothetical protein
VEILIAMALAGAAPGSDDVVIIGFDRAPNERQQRTAGGSVYKFSHLNVARRYRYVRVNGTTKNASFGVFTKCN